MGFISGLFSMLIVVYLFGKIRGFIFNRTFNQLKKKYNGVTSLKINQKSLKEEALKIAKETLPAQVKVLELSELNASIGNTYKKTDKEKFEIKKFRKIFDLGDKVEWIKSIKEIIDLRKLLVYSLILAAVSGWFYHQGRGDTPVKIDLDYAKEFKMKIDGHYLVKPKNSQNIRIEDKKGNIIKDIKAKDFPLLAKKLKPIGLILEPVGIMGLGAGTVSGFEAGAGISFIKYWKWRLDAFLTNRGIYAGTSYQITDNSGLGLGVGKGFDASNRIILYYKWRF